MRNLLSLYISICSCLLFSCGAENQRHDLLVTLPTDSLEAVQDEPLRTKNSNEADTTSFKATFSQFINALQAGDTAALNTFVSTETGFWLIEQPGAVPVYTHYSKVQDVKRQYQQQLFTSLNQQVKQCQLQQRQELPMFDCTDMDQGRSGFAADGCFYSTNTSRLRSNDMWKYASSNEQQAKQVQELQRQVDVAVLHTNSAFRFYFGYSNGRWLLLFADLRVPCSA